VAREKSRELKAEEKERSLEALNFGPTNPEVALDIMMPIGRSSLCANNPFSG
jgi:hypothetical protein